MDGQRCIICHKPWRNGEIKHDKKCPSALPRTHYYGDDCEPPHVLPWDDPEHDVLADLQKVKIEGRSKYYSPRVEK